MVADTVTLDEFKRRLVELCARRGKSGFPRRQRDRHILLKSVTLTFDKTKEYTERQVNQQLLSWLQDVGCWIELDHVNLRRDLVDLGYLARSKDGSRYWVAVSSRSPTRFAPEVEGVDVHAIVQEGRALIERRKQEYMQAFTAKKP